MESGSSFEQLAASSFNSARRRLADQMPDVELPDEIDDEDLEPLPRCHAEHPDYPGIFCVLAEGKHYQGKHGFLVRWPQEDTDD